MNGTFDAKELQQRLSGRLHERDITALSQWAEADLEARDEVFSLMFHADKRMADNAVWVLTHLSKGCNAWLQDRQKSLANEAMMTGSTTRRRLLLTLLTRTTFGKETVDAPFLDFCLGLIVSAEEPVGVKTASLKLAHAQCIHYEELANELHAVLALLPESELKPALRCAIKKVTRQ
ncbi:MAG: hypothetical protein IJ196_02175 [Prevotella sp.]|nr:hypothetical protein [Prevotella sp.]